MLYISDEAHQETGTCGVTFDNCAINKCCPGYRCTYYAIYIAPAARWQCAPEAWFDGEVL